MMSVILQPTSSFVFSSGSISGCYSQVAAVVIDDSSKVIVAVQFYVVWISLDGGTWSGTGQARKGLGWIWTALRYQPV